MLNFRMEIAHEFLRFRVLRLVKEPDEESYFRILMAL